MILLVEDEKDLREVSAELLEVILGSKVTTAENGQAAKELIQDGYSSGDKLFIISDVNMPVMGGFDLADWLHGTDYIYKMILISGYFENLPLAKEKYPEIDFLEKPLDYDKLGLLIEGFGEKAA